MPVTEADLDGYSLLVRIAVRRTTAEAYSSGWQYTLHYGATDTGESAVPTLSDGTIRRYDNATKRRRDTNCTSHRTQSRRSWSFPEWSLCTSGSGVRFRNRRSNHD
jgi:hypothetical protein